MGICCSCISCNSAAGPDPATTPATAAATAPATDPATPAPELALDPFPDPDIVPTSPGNLTEGWFLNAATFNFRSDMLLGKGGFGSVYKGLLNQKVPIEGIRKLRIAVKKLDSNSKQGLRQWQTEVGFLARVSHPNIVKLLGYCQAEGDKELLIVYEFMEKGSLNYHLFGKRSDRILPWETRVRIATGMAQALSYLHTMEKPVIFRDFKTSNILLNESYIPKLSDFGLAKWGPNDGGQYVTGNVLGTRGYVGPEYKSGGRLYVKSDVYSFGVVLVEMLTGLRAIDKNRPPGKQNLREWT
ncbi:hypothetical protein POTOM_025004 [Populus tomentosa]|uniref:Protein kinase domain-containing protein n=1 Tax=Populus tomentosa TaxID=118781 RepID=A0A8X7ZD92_POPTO|nr:hypothetical protein POTOM_025004 [Populus tomentosa]